MPDNTKFTFWGLIDNYYIEIPMIQRDYAQGRKNDRVKKIRESILDSLYYALDTDSEHHSPVDFDFIYGRIENNIKLIPIDGQQRLTTLFLLHWYLSRADKDNLEDINEKLLKFTYTTRDSSTEFLTGLIKECDLINNYEERISEYILDSHWFIASWKHDPTVVSMLIMLDAIHVKFNKKLFWERLKNSTFISFQFKPMEELELDDSIYIRMNSRGKELTNFENFKALFEQFLTKNHTEQLKHEFSTNTDIRWTEFLWDFVKDRDDLNIIDPLFLRLFNFICRIVFFRGEYEISNFILNKKYEEDSTHWSILFEDKKNAEYLISTINYISEIYSNNTYVNAFENIKLFDGTKDLIKECIFDNDFTITKEVYLYFLLSALQSNLIDNKDEFEKRFRILRNLLSRIRQFNWPIYNTNIRQENMADYLKIADYLLNISGELSSASLEELKVSGFSKESVNYELNKLVAIENRPELRDFIYKLEDNENLQGSIHSILNDNISKFHDLFIELWKEDKNTLYRALLTLEGSNGLLLSPGSTNLGYRYYYALSNWKDFLTNPKNKNLITRFLKEFIKFNEEGKTYSDVLQLIIDDWLGNNLDYTSWKYYLIKYPQIIGGNDRYNYIFLKWESKNFEVTKTSKTSARGYHINPFISVVVSQVNNVKISNIDWCYGQDSDRGALYLWNDIELWCEEDSWGIVIPNNLELPDTVLDSLGEVDTEGAYRLKESDNRDRIEVAVDWINNLYNELGDNN